MHLGALCGVAMTLTSSRVGASERRIRNIRKPFSLLCYCWSGGGMTEVFIRKTAKNSGDLALTEKREGGTEEHRHKGVCFWWKSLVYSTCTRAASKHVLFPPTTRSVTTRLQFAPMLACLSVSLDSQPEPRRLAHGEIFANPRVTKTERPIVVWENPPRAK